MGVRRVQITDASCHIFDGRKTALPTFLKASRADSAGRGLVLGADEHIVEQFV